MPDETHSSDFQRGEAAARAHSLSEKMDRVEKDVTQLREEVHEIKMTLARIEGAWKVAVVFAATASAIVGTIVGYVMRFVFDK